MIDDETARRIVRDGYDSISDRYTSWATGELSPGRAHALRLVYEMVPHGARVLELGCGAGVPMTKALASRYSVHGVDISERQVDQARHNVPMATFERVD